jgi:hypothetical protein
MGSGHIALLILNLSTGNEWSASHPGPEALVPTALVPQKYFDILYGRHAQIPGVRMPRHLNFVWWCQILVNIQYGSCFMSPFWYLEFSGASHIFGNFTLPCYMDTRGSKYAAVLRLGKYGNTELSLLPTLYSMMPQIMHSWPMNLPLNSLLSLLLHAACQFPSFLRQGLFTLTQWHQP